jgi:hypothetical protein
LFTARASDDSLVTSCMEVFDSTKVIDSTKAIDNTKANVELKISTPLYCTLQRIVALVIVPNTQAAAITSQKWPWSKTGPPRQLEDQKDVAAHFKRNLKCENVIRLNF